MKVLITGDRDWKDWRAIRNALARLPIDITIIHGAARGADRIAGEIARRMGMAVDPHPADWTRYSKGAGHIRNREMLDLKPDLVLWFHDDLLGRSKGTKDCVLEAIRRGIPVFPPLGPRSSAPK